MTHWLASLGVELPIIQAPMAGVQDHKLAVAVSNAGGLGSIPCALLDPQQLRGELSALAAQTGRPFNVNFFCHRPTSPDPERLERWRAALTPYYREMGLDPVSAPSGPGRAAFNQNVLDIIQEFRPPVVSFHFGLPAPELLTQVRRWGAKILSSATTVDEARWLEANGADAVIVQGLEAGGHRGMFLSDDLTTQTGTFALLSQVLAAVHVPVIASGGIADAGGVARALSLGAAAVQVGTAYMLCPESTTSAVHRAALTSDAGRRTVITNVFTGRPARGIENRLIRELGGISPLAPPFPWATGAIVLLRKEAERRGNGDFSPMWAGQDVTGCREIPAAELTRDLAATAG
jgi:nitronate monooxygenase